MDEKKIHAERESQQETGDEAEGLSRAFLDALGTKRVEEAARGLGACDQYDSLHWLRRYGNADELHLLVRILEAVQEWLGEDLERESHREDDAIAHAAAGVLLDRVRWLRDTAAWLDWTLDEMGWKYNKEAQTLKESKVARGRPASIISRAIGEAFDDLGLTPKDPYYTPSTYAAIRAKLVDAGVIRRPDAAEALSDDLIRRAIERHVDKRR